MVSKQFLLTQLFIFVDVIMSFNIDNCDGFKQFLLTQLFFFVDVIMSFNIDNCDGFQTIPFNTIIYLC